MERVKLGAFPSVNGIDIHYRLEGEGPETIVLINGLADDLETWGFQTPALVEARYRVLSFDNRGVGETSKPPGPYTSRMLADDAKGACRLSGAKRLPPDGCFHGGK